MLPRLRPARRAAGFTLVETAVASAILAVALLATAGLLLSGVRLTAEARHASIALALATTVAEQLHGLGLEPSVRAFGSAGCRPASDRACRFEWRDGDLDEGLTEVRWSSLDGAPLDDAIALRAEVEVSWREGPRRREIVLVAVRGS